MSVLMLFGYEIITNLSFIFSLEFSHRGKNRSSRPLPLPSHSRMNTQIPQNILGFLWLLEEIAIENEIHPDHKFTFHEVVSEGVETFFQPNEGLLDIRVFWDVNMFVNYFTPRSGFIEKSSTDAFRFIQGLTSEVIKEAGFPAFTGGPYPEINEQDISGYAIYSTTIPGTLRALFAAHPEQLTEAFARVNYRNQTLPPIEEFELVRSLKKRLRIGRFQALAWNSTFLSYLMIFTTMPDLRKWRLNENRDTFLGVLRENDDILWLGKYEAFWNKWSELHNRFFRISTLKSIIRQDLEATFFDGRLLLPGRYTVKEYSPWRIIYTSLELDIPLPILESLMFVGAFDV